MRNHPPRVDKYLASRGWANEMRIYEKITKNIFIFLGLVFIDQLSKYLIRSQGGFYICNKGIAFGIKLPEAIILCLSIALVLSLVCLIFNFKFEILNEIKINKLKNLEFIENLKFKIENYKPARVGAILIIAGAAANIMDRLIYSCVIDFIDLKLWPVFNFADIYITLGAISILFSFFEGEKENNNSR